MSSIRFAVVAAAASVALSAAVTPAAVITIDPDGPAGANPALQVGSLDFLPGNSINRNVLPESAAPFVTLFQARLGSLLNASGDPILVPGLNNPGGANAFEITAVARFDLAAVSQTPGPFSTSTSTAIVPGTGFIELYYDATPDADDLAGTGFNDGVRILGGVATFGGGSFVQFNQVPLVPFDQFGTDNYTGRQSVTGVGGLSIDANVTSVDAGFFLAGPAVISLNGQTTNSTPFRQIDPSAQFWDGTALVPANVGAINGVSGPDIQLQTDATVSFNVIPEPASFALLAPLGLAALRRRRA